MSSSVNLNLFCSVYRRKIFSLWFLSEIYSILHPMNCNIIRNFTSNNKHTTLFGLENPKSSELFMGNIWVSWNFTSMLRAEHQNRRQISKDAILRFQSAKRDKSYTTGHYRVVVSQPFSPDPRSEWLNCDVKWINIYLQKQINFQFGIFFPSFVEWNSRKNGLSHEWNLELRTPPTFTQKELTYERKIITTFTKNISDAMTTMKNILIFAE